LSLIQQNNPLSELDDKLKFVGQLYDSASVTRTANMALINESSATKATRIT